MAFDQIAHTSDTAVSVDLGLELDLLLYAKKCNPGLSKLSVPGYDVISHSDCVCCVSFSGFWLIIPFAVLESPELKLSVN